MSFAKLKMGKDLIAIIDGTRYHVTPDHRNYEMVKAAYMNGDKDAFINAFNKKEKTFEEFVEEESDGLVKLEGNTVYYKGKPIHNTLTKRIIECYNEGDKHYESMLLFLENLMQNPSKNSVDQLYNFLENQCLPITEDGCFLGYKYVNEDFTACHANEDGTHNDCSVGKVVEMPRNEVCDDPDISCSTGLHVGGLSYAGYSNNVIIVKVNPRDAVSVPHGESDKLRCCRFEVVDVYKEPLKDVCYNTDNEVESTSSFNFSCDDVNIMDKITFDYTDGDGIKTYKRQAIVIDILSDRFAVRLTKNDYRVGLEEACVGDDREFLFERIENLRIS